MKSNPSELSIPLETGATTALVYPAAAAIAGAALILGHGAGAGQQSAFMVRFARALAALGIDVVTFNFPYIEQRRKIPDRAPVLEACFRSVIDGARAELASARARLYIGGKSMGGRIATQVAAANPDLPLAGLVLFGYPLHPPGKPDQRRDGHLPGVGRPMLFVHGTRDPFGSPAELSSSVARIQPPPAVHFVDGGDHSLAVSRKDAKAQAVSDAAVQQAVAAWIAP